MAFVYVCDNCLDGYHLNCEGSTWERDGVEQQGYGGGMCVCSHGEYPDHPFEKATRESSEVQRRHRA